jgi:hypothetical protein
MIIATHRKLFLQQMFLLLFYGFYSTKQQDQQLYISSHFLGFSHPSTTSGVAFTLSIPVPVADIISALIAFPIFQSLPITTAAMPGLVSCKATSQELMRMMIWHLVAFLLMFFFVVSG